MRIQENIERAMRLARIIHGDQVDKRDRPYMDHITDIAYRVQELGHVFQIVAILHDTIEDTKSRNLARDYDKRSVMSSEISSTMLW